MVTGFGPWPRLHIHRVSAMGHEWEDRLQLWHLGDGWYPARVRCDLVSSCQGRTDPPCQGSQGSVGPWSFWCSVVGCCTAQSDVKV